MTGSAGKLDLELYRRGTSVYASLVGASALAAPLFAAFGTEAGALRNWQLGALLLAAIATVARAIRGPRAPETQSAPSSGKPWVPAALGVWMLSGLLLDFAALRVNGIDFSVFDWMLESTLRGRFMYSRIYDVPHFGVHQTWWMVPLVGVHALWRSPVALLTCNAAVLAAAGLVLWRLVRPLDPTLADLAAIAHATNPWVGRLLRDGFRPESFYPLMLYLLVFALWRRRAIWAALAGLGVCLVKEDGPFYALAMGSVAALLGTWAPAVAACSLLAFAGILLLDLEVVRPWQLGARGPGYLAFWSEYGDSLPGVVRSVLFHPLRAARDVLSAGWWRVMGPTLFLPLRSATCVAGIVTGVVMLGLSSNPQLHRFEGYYPVPIASIALCGIVLSSLREGWSRESRILSSGIALVLFPLFGNGYLRIAWPDAEIRNGVRAVDALVARAPGPVCVQAIALPQLSYSERVAPLDARCRSEAGSTLVLNPRLDPWPDTRADLEQAISTARSVDVLPGGFVVLPPGSATGWHHPRW